MPLVAEGNSVPLEWLQTAGGNMLIAIIGKLLPYTIIFIAMSIFANYIYFGIFDIPMDCSSGPEPFYFSIVRTFYTGIGCLLFPHLGIEVSLSACVNGGFVRSYSFRVTFPVPHMYAPVYYASYLFPCSSFY